MAKKKSSAPEVTTVAPLDFGSIAQSAGQASNKATKKQMDLLFQNLPKLEQSTFQTIGNVATVLGDGGTLYAYQYYKPTQGEIKAAKKAGEEIPKAGFQKIPIGEVPKNEYTAEARALVDDAAAQRAQINALASQVAGVGASQLEKADQIFAEQPTELERMLERDATEELGLGRSLSAQQIRDSQQSIRQAFAARGLGSGLGSAAAELLNRDVYATQRQNQRRAFATGTSQMMAQNLFNRRAQAAQFAGIGGQALGQAANTYNMSANLGLQSAANLAQLDPVRSGMALGANMAGAARGDMMNLMGSNYGNATGLAGTVANANANIGMFNANAQNWANSAGMFQPSFQSGMGSTIGSIAGGVLGGAAGYFASGGNPLFAMGGYTAGSQIGGGIGGGFR